MCLTFVSALLSFFFLFRSLFEHVGISITMITWSLRVINQLEKLERENDRLKADLDDIMGDKDITTFEGGQYKADIQVACYELRLKSCVGNNQISFTASRRFELWTITKTNSDQNDGA